MVKVCLSCNRESKDHAGFCDACGKKLSPHVGDPGFVSWLLEENKIVKAENDILKHETKVSFDPENVQDLDCEIQNVKREIDEAAGCRDFAKADQLQQELVKLTDDRELLMKLLSEFAEALAGRDFEGVGAKALAIHAIITKTKDAPAPIASDQVDAPVALDRVCVELCALMQTVSGPEERDLKQIYEGVKEKKREMYNAEREIKEAREGRNFNKAHEHQNLMNACREQFVQLLEQFLQPKAATSTGAGAASEQATAAISTATPTVAQAATPIGAATSGLVTAATTAASKTMCMIPGCPKPTYASKENWYCGNNHVAMGKFKVGAMVQAKYKDGKWHTAKVDRLNGQSNIVTVSWMDPRNIDDREKKHPPGPGEKEVRADDGTAMVQFKVDDIVNAKSYKDGCWHSAKVASLDGALNMIKVNWKDPNNTEDREKHPADVAMDNDP